MYVVAVRFHCSGKCIYMYIIYIVYVIAVWCHSSCICNVMYITMYIC